eukprot:Blabericola_migrator_1__8191@NODE_4234_length_1267_cov_12_059167_g2617_i0_p1_GENE_NODE_4234_length_1267_cov_12_059167_g2617_i0NODE_4234_length_1267_cov_12_059167_g2617_i0_p1_ORF_typecomplete_len166_score23_09PBP1_TM/PF14812_6/0_49_NODE_4234_length_1267_cov_12_059167_g2617_i06611158
MIILPILLLLVAVGATTFDEDVSDEQCRAGIQHITRHHGNPQSVRTMPLDDFISKLKKYYVTPLFGWYMDDYTYGYVWKPLTACSQPMAMAYAALSAIETYHTKTTQVDYGDQADQAQYDDEGEAQYDDEEEETATLNQSKTKKSKPFWKKIFKRGKKQFVLTAE